MNKVIDIDALMVQTWLTVAQLRHGGQVTDGPALYAACKAQVESVREALERAGLSTESIDHITYAQCALLDETVMNRKPEAQQPENRDAIISASSGQDALNMTLDAGQRAWRSAPLQAVYFGSLRAGEALYDRIAEVLRQPAPEPAVLVCYQRVLALGFQGQYSLSGVGQSQRDEVIAALNERVPPPKAGGSLVVQKTGRRRYTLLRSVWFWMVLAVVLTGAVWLGGYLWLQDLLNQQLPEHL
ncbi:MULTISPECIES: type VI secretion system protein TssL, short form [Tatumella]|uniref:Type VI secretion system protein TssL, short form n=1 Tax=Tatumella punctata TaxID=399969 RepID=A0ABW1VUW2_9GAMM|nr:MULTISPECIES: type VI secretion system protein TssL, short form [unclassified Tatumella]MBS0857672.1 type VI secretion system protein TssL, short form [Tatumella sp. JGM16]MBS0878500.1 type VI secretion system protein TssL, short form [Tatumella sp. JGM82]MBS0891967.1 type VI secretion system protein TssL, short form [Tatumella sp. JGM94]MBS0903085.1 type VI secretion system protein TssL, short form [Tatumella sp. JGM100]MBS0914356.1 type VI secretion system protein TssL, short form [Tatume